MPANWCWAEKATTRMYDKPTQPRSPDAEKFLPGRPPARRIADPKEKLTAWQRWEMTSIAEGLRPAVPRETKAVPASVLEPLAPVLLIDEAELARLRREAQKAGETEGHKEGYARGQAEGHAAGIAAAREQAGQLQALTQALPAALRLAEGKVADDLLALALDIARQVLGQALTVDPHAMLGGVRALLQAEPALTGTPQLYLHPDDAALVKAHLTDDLQTAGWRIRVDATITRGGCRVLASSGELDATLESRWDRVAATLARSAPAAANNADD